MRISSIEKTAVVITGKELERAGDEKAEVSSAEALLKGAIRILKGAIIIVGGIGGAISLAFPLSLPIVYVLVVLVLKFF